MTERMHICDPAALRLIEGLRDHVGHVMRACSTPGLNVALALNGVLAWEAGFGFADLARKQLCTPDTAYHSGSLGKTYTGTAVMVLVDRGVIKLEEPINQHLPFEVHNPLGAREITILDLMTHRSGLGIDGALSLFTAPRPLATELQDEYAKPNGPMVGGILPRWASSVGQTWCYSNLGVATLGLIVEHANLEKQSFSDFVQTHVMSPLGQTHSQYPPVQDAAHLRSELVPLMSQGYARMGAAQIPTLPVHFGEYPAGGVIQRPADHIRLILAMMSGGELDGGRVLSAASVERMLTPASSEPVLPRPVHTASDVLQGLIWRLTDVGTTTMSFDHGGSHMFGWRTQGRGWPMLRAAIVVGSNQWSLPDDSLDVEQVCDFVGQWLRFQPTATPTLPEIANWPWLLSYVRGGLYAASYLTLIGVAGDLPSDALARVIEDTRPAHESLDDWNADAFRRGFDDFRAHGRSLEQARSFWTSPGCGVTQAELKLALAMLGTKSPSMLSALF